MKLPDGTYYQVCVLCGSEYVYDWQRMRRTKVRLSERTPGRSSAVSQVQPHVTD